MSKNLARKNFLKKKQSYFAFHNCPLIFMMQKVIFKWNPGVWGRLLMMHLSADRVKKN